jgi:nicotinamidase-related amidase
MTRVTVELDIPEPKAVKADPRRTLVVLVDLENEWCAPEGDRYMGEEVGGVLRDVAALVIHARDAGARILWVRSVRRPDAIEVRAFGRTPRLLEGSWATEFTPPLAPAEGEKIVVKHSHDCFNGTGLDQWLTQQGIDPPDWTVMIAGVALDVCVNHAVLGFSVRDHRVVVLLDCVAPNVGSRAAATLVHYGYRGYSYNVTVSESRLVDWSTSDAVDFRASTVSPLQ